MRGKTIGDQELACCNTSKNNGTPASAKWRLRSVSRAGWRAPPC